MNFNDFNTIFLYLNSLFGPFNQIKIVVYISKPFDIANTGLDQLANQWIAFHFGSAYFVYSAYRYCKRDGISK